MDTTTDSARRRPGARELIGALWSARTWRSLAHLVTGGAIGCCGGFTLLCSGIVAVAGAPTIVLSLAVCDAPTNDPRRPCRCTADRSRQPLSRRTVRVSCR